MDVHRNDDINQGGVTYLETLGKILMICTYFAPDASIAAVRTTKLAKYLSTCGYHVDFLMEGNKSCGEDEILRHDAEGIPVFQVENSQRFVSFANRYKKWIKPYKEKRFNNLENRRKLNKRTGQIEFYPFETAYPLLGSLDYIVEQLRQKDLFREAKKMLKEMEGYDYVITSYGDSFSYFCGAYLKAIKKQHGCLICGMRFIVIDLYRRAFDLFQKVMRRRFGRMQMRLREYQERFVTECR